MADESPETGFAQGSFTALAVMSTGIAITLFSVLYFMFQSNLLPFKSIITYRSNQQGVLNSVTAVFVILTIMITTFIFQRTIPQILNDPDKMNEINDRIRGQIIPVSATLFFILFVYQFIVGNVESAPGIPKNTSSLMLIMIVFAIGAVSYGIRHGVGTNPVLVVAILSILGVGSVYLVNKS